VGGAGALGAPHTAYDQHPHRRRARVVCPVAEVVIRIAVASFPCASSGTRSTCQQLTARCRGRVSGRYGMPQLWHIGACALIAMLVSACTVSPPVSPVEPIYFFASQAGRQTLDQGEGGGNPFASALVELLARDSLTFRALRTELVELTELRSRRFQRPEVLARVDFGTWQLLPKPTAERRVALVVVFSDYSASSALRSLPGAKHDMDRVAVALDRAGFEVQTVLDPDQEKLEMALREFADRSAASEVALLYTTGHGAEVKGTVYLLPGDYPRSQGGAMLRERAVRLTDLGSTLRANRVNMVFYGGCRNNPFGRG
jgi:hypothetical protein